MNRRRFIHRTAAAAAAGVGGSLARRLAVGAGRSRDAVRVVAFGMAHPHAVGKLAALQELGDDYEVVGVVEPDAQLRRKLEAHPKIRALRWLSEDEALSTGLANAAVIETSVRETVPTARRCVDAGLHVHVEKPGGESHADFAALVQAAQDRGLHMQMGYMFRYNPAFQLCLRAVREGWLGDVSEISGYIGKLVPGATRQELAEYRGGIMFELGSHLVDFVVALLGAPDEVASSGVATRSGQDALVDSQLAVLRYPRAIASIRSSAVDPQGQQRRRLTVVGDGGVLEIQPLEPPQMKLTLQRAAGGFQSGEQAAALPPSAGRYHDQLAEFAAVIRGERQPMFTAEHDLAVHRAVLEASGAPIEPTTGK